MSQISRNLLDGSRQRYDLLVVGGGIYGVTLTLEAARRGLKVLLVERDDFGGATSLNSLRIVHGGLRYLQHLDFSRFRRSVAEQAWWLTHFPEIVEPLGCLMPLYNRGLKRRSVMYAALHLNQRLATTVRRHALGEAAGNLLPHGRILGTAETSQRFQAVDQVGLRGGALWYDARMKSPQRLLIEALRWAITCGASAYNYTKCVGLLDDGNRCIGIRAECQVTGDEYEFRAKSVVNCTGPWVGSISTQEKQLPDENRLAIAFNVTLDRSPVAEDALALTPRRPGAPTYFLVPYGARTMVGTVHIPYAPSISYEPHVQNLLTDLNSMIPGWEVTQNDVVDVLTGKLPASQANSHIPSKTPKMIHHTSRGERGLTSVVGVKYTTARHIAQRTLEEIYGRQGRGLPEYGSTARPAITERPDLSELLSSSNSLLAQDLHNWISDESVIRLDDLLIRRSDALGVQGVADHDAIKRQVERLIGLHESEHSHNTIKTNRSSDGEE